MALGARHTQVLWMVLRQALAFAIAGVAVGVPLSLWVGKYVASLLFGLSPRDPVTLSRRWCSSRSPRSQDICARAVPRSSNRQP